MVDNYLTMQVLFTIIKVIAVVAKECIANVHTMLRELYVVWHTISFKQGRL